MKKIAVSCYSLALIFNVGLLAVPTLYCLNGSGRLGDCISLVLNTDALRIEPIICVCLLAILLLSIAENVLCYRVLSYVVAIFIVLIVLRECYMGPSIQVVTIFVVVWGRYWQIRARKWAAKI